MIEATGDRPAPGPALLVVAAAAYVAAGGYVHLREWLDLYRHLPASLPGSAVVRVGFPVTAAVSAVLAVALLAGARRGGRLLVYVVVGAFLFQAASIAALVVSRTGSLFGWSEATWTGGASQALLTEIAALASLALATAIAALARSHPRARPAVTHGPEFRGSSRPA